MGRLAAGRTLVLPKEARPDGEGALPRGGPLGTLPAALQVAPRSSLGPLEGGTSLAAAAAARIGRPQAASARQTVAVLHILGCRGRQEGLPAAPQTLAALEGVHTGAHHRAVLQASLRRHHQLPQGNPSDTALTASAGRLRTGPAPIQGRREQRWGWERQTVGECQTAGLKYRGAGKGRP